MRLTSLYSFISYRIVYISPYHDGFSRDKSTVSAQFIIHKNYTNSADQQNADKMMTRLINCPTDWLIHFVSNQYLRFFTFFLRHFDTPLSLSPTQFAQFVIVIARRF